MKRLERRAQVSLSRFKLIGQFLFLRNAAAACSDFSFQLFFKAFRYQQKNKWRIVFAMLAVILSSSAAWATTNLVATSGSWTFPAGVTSVQVECWGGGGAGGGATRTSGSGNSAGGGGAGGAYSKTTVSVSSAATYTITVGSGGTGVSAANGNNGNDSSFNDPTPTTLALAKGGGGGASGVGAGGTFGIGGTSPSGSTGTINLGGSGAAGTATGSGGCGCSGGSSSAGGNASVTTGGTAGSGGGGAGANGTGSSASGNTATAVGGGGSGANASSSSPRTGGGGAAGQVILTYHATYYSKGSLDPGLTSSWTIARDGSGSNPSDFTTGDTFVIQNGHMMATTATWTISGSGSKLEIENGGVLTANNAVSISGSTTFQVDGGGKYRHAQNSGTIPTATWAATSTCEIAGVTSTVPGGLGQSFGNFTWNCSGQTTDRDLAGALTTVNGNFTVQNTAGFNLRLSLGSSQTFTCGGDLTVNGSASLYPQSSSGSSGNILNIGGNFSVASGGTFDATSGGVVAINFNGSSPQTFANSGTIGDQTRYNWKVNSGSTLTLNSSLTVNTGGSFTVAGTLNCGGNIINGTGAFALNSGGTLGIGSTLGITSTTSSGNIQVTGTHTFDTAANYSYNGTASQAVGNQLPTSVNNLTIANTGSSGNNTVTLAQNIAVNGTLSTTSGTLDLNGKTLTAASAPSLGSGLQMEILNAVAANNLALSSGTLTYGGMLTVANSGALASGNSFTLFTAPGNSFSGWFNTVTLPALASGLAWDTNKLATTGVLDIYSFTTNAVEAMSTGKNTAANLLIAKLLSKAASSRGTVALSSVSAGSAQGGTVAISGSNISYSPASDFTGSDSFTAVLSDGHGSITAMVVVTVTDPNSSSGNGSNLSIRSDGGGGVVIIIAGSPGTNYVLQYNTTLSTSGWNTFTNFTMPLTGITNYADSVSLGSRYYRTIQP